VSPSRITGPLVIGGVGGSGTRVVAEMSRALGIYMGADLNRASDNLWFHLLLTRPHWYFEQLAQGGPGIAKGLAILEGAMQGRLTLDQEVNAFLAEASADVDRQRLGRKWAKYRIKSLRAAASGQARSPWGWKEPNSHVYLEHLDAHFGPDLRYVHVIRHGLDMAYSSNQQQMHKWRSLYGMDPDEAPSESVVLEYWIRANTRAIDLGRARLGERFLVVNFDALCADPTSGVEQLVRFLGMEPTPALAKQLVGTPSLPQSTGRWQQMGLGPFTPQQLEQVRALGFAVPA
jgi:sulfotransferase family protein